MVLLSQFLSMKGGAGGLSDPKRTVTILYSEPLHSVLYLLSNRVESWHNEKCVAHLCDDNKFVLKSVIVALKSYI